MDVYATEIDTDTHTIVYFFNIENEKSSGWRDVRLVNITRINKETEEVIEENYNPEYHTPDSGHYMSRSYKTRVKPHVITPSSMCVYMGGDRIMAYLDEDFFWDGKDVIMW